MTGIGVGKPVGGKSSWHTEYMAFTLAHWTSLQAPGQQRRVGPQASPTSLQPGGGGGGGGGFGAQIGGGGACPPQSCATMHTSAALQHGTAPGLQTSAEWMQASSGGVGSVRSEAVQLQPPALAQPQSN